MYELPSSAPEAQNNYDAATPIEYDPDLFLDLSPVRDHLEYLNNIGGDLETACDSVVNHESRLKAAVDELWDGENNLRKRGLRGGTARKQRSIKGNYVKFRTHTPQELEHRKKVEATDLLGRNRLLGLKALKDLFAEAFTYICEEQHNCQELLDCSDRWDMTADPMAVIGRFATAIEYLLRQESMDKLEDIAGMVQVFNEEYNAAL